MGTTTKAARSKTSNNLTDPRFWDGLAEPVLRLLRTRPSGLLRSEINEWAASQSELQKPGRLLNVLAHLANKRLAHAEVVAEEMRQGGGELRPEAVCWRSGPPPKRVRLPAQGQGRPFPIRGPAHE